MKRIFIGPANISNLSSSIEKSLKFIGIQIDFITWSSWIHPFNYENNKVFPLINNVPFKILGKNIFYFLNEYFLKPIYFLFALVKYDVFLFIKPTTFLKNNIDLKILKLLNKKVGLFLVGCPDRAINFDADPAYICNTCSDITKQLNCLCNNIPQKIARVNYFEKHSDFIFGLNDTVAYIQNKSKVYHFRYPMPDIIVKAQDKDYNGKLKICHLPSNPLLKGTHIIEPILTKLAREENIEVILKKEIWPRERIIKELQSSHILIDSIASYTFGTICLEAIQYGCVALNAYPDWIAEYYEIPPIIKINSDTLYTILVQLIKDRILLKEYAERSQEAYNKYFLYQSTGNYYKKIINSY